MPKKRWSCSSAVVGVEEKGVQTLAVQDPIMPREPPQFFPKALEIWARGRGVRSPRYSPSLPSGQPLLTPNLHPTGQAGA